MSLRFVSKALLPALIASVVLRAAVPGSASAAEAYALGPSDKLRITVSQWASPGGGSGSQWPQATGDFQTRLDGQFTIDTAGNLSLPLVGEVHAEGRGTSELARAISELFQSKLGTITVPSASVEIVEHRPFYIVGVVDRPGSYPFRPNMTVLHALSIAGGMYRRPDSDLSRYERELLAVVGDRSLQSVNRDLLLGRVSRLEAELAGKDAIGFSEELLARKDELPIARMMADETKAMKHRQTALDTAVANQLHLKTLAERQNVALEAQSTAVDRQWLVAKKELEDQTDLVTRGLSRRPILFPIESRLAEAEGKKRQLQSDILKNAQDIARADQASLELRAIRRTEILDQLKEAQGSIYQVTQKIATDQRIIQRSETEVQRRSGEAVPTYTILRRDGDRLRERAVAETAPVEPGDIVRIFLVTRDGSSSSTSDGPTAALSRETHLNPARP